MRSFRLLRWPVVGVLIVGLLVLAVAGPLAQAALERALERCLTTRVCVRRVVPRLFASSVETGRISVDNPPDFGRGEVLELDDIETSIAISSFLESRVEIDVLKIGSTKVTLEIGLQGTGLNLLSLRDAVRQRMAQHAARSASSSNEERPRRFKIHRIILENIQLELGAQLAAGSDSSVDGERRREGEGEDEGSRSGDSSPTVRVYRKTFGMADNWYTLDEVLERLLSELVRVLVLAESAGELELPGALGDLVAALGTPEEPAGEGEFPATPTGSSQEAASD
ncbi:MAG: hypothetical protein O7J95_06730 [Planctomycetota bacterium]|nr:hypothetical protein [Planctomycetota bacterium]